MGKEEAPPERRTEPLDSQAVCSSSAQCVQESGHIWETHFRHLWGRGNGASNATPGPARPFPSCRCRAGKQERPWGSPGLSLPASVKGCLRLTETRPGFRFCLAPRRPASPSSLFVRCFIVMVANDNLTLERVQLSVQAGPRGSGKACQWHRLPLVLYPEERKGTA